jgi:hypothetical protein
MVVVSGNALNGGNTKSCGCWRVDEIAARNTTHGMCGTKELQMLDSAKYYAKKKGLPFNLELSDIVIPEFCPVLGIKLNINNVGKPKDDSPSLDKFIPTLGYVKGNVQVISFRANWIKQNATLAEVHKLYQWMEKTSCHTS